MSRFEVLPTPEDVEPRPVRLPPDEISRVLTALAVYANTEEYRKDNPERAKSIRQTARCIALQVGDVQ